MISRRALLLASVVLAGCRPRLSIPRYNDVLIPVPRELPADGRLLRKALQFEVAMAEHLTSDGMVVTERTGSPRLHDPLNIQDGAIWTGCYVAAEALRLMATDDPVADERLTLGLNALHMLQDVTGVPGVLARMVKRAKRPVPGEWPTWRQGTGRWSEFRWLGDVSVDQYAGVLFGYSVAFEAVLDDARRREIVQRVTGLVDGLARNRWRIVDADGHPTKHSDLTVGQLTEPLNALLALSFAAVAAQVSQDDKYRWTYDDLIERGYPERAVRARDPWWEYLFGVNHSDNNLAYLGLYPLIRAETNETRLAQYRRSLRRVWGVVRNEGNPMFTFMTRVLDSAEWANRGAMEQAIRTLARFPFPKRDETRRNSTRTGICRAWFDDRHGYPQACSPLPPDERPRSSFEWASNPYRLDRRGDAAVRLAGVDYLVAYWMGRRHGLLSLEQ